MTNSKYSNEAQILTYWINSGKYTREELHEAMYNVLLNSFNDGVKAAIEAKPEANPRTWAANQPQMAWTLGFEKAVEQWESNLKALIGGDA